MFSHSLPFNPQLADAQTAELSLKAQLANAHSIADQKTREITDFQNRMMVTHDLHEQRLSEVSAAKEKIIESQAIINNCQDEMDSCNDKKDKLCEDIVALKVIANEPSPPELWGNYCENGHLNCPNLPGVVYRLGNKEEIDAHNRKVQQALDDIKHKEQELAEINSRLAELSSKQFSATMELQNAQAELSIAEGALHYTESSLNQEQDWQETLQKQYQDVQADIARLEASLGQQATVIGQITEQQAQASASANNAALQEIARQELLNERQSAMEALLRDLARQELEQESNARGRSAPSSDIPYVDPFAKAVAEIHDRLGIPAEIDFTPQMRQQQNTYANNDNSSVPSNHSMQQDRPTYSNNNGNGQSPSAPPSMQRDPFASLNNSNVPNPSRQATNVQQEPSARINNNSAVGSRDPFASVDSAPTPSRHSPTFFSKVYESVVQSYNESQQRQADLKAQQDEQRNRHDYVPNPATQRMLDNAHAAVLNLPVVHEPEPEKAPSFLPQMQHMADEWEKNKALLQKFSQDKIKKLEKEAPDTVPPFVLEKGIKHLVDRRIVSEVTDENINVYKGINKNAQDNLDHAFDPDHSEKKEQIREFMEGDNRDRKDQIIRHFKK